MSELINEPSIIELRAAHAENALRPGGVLHDIAKNLLTEDIELSPSDVADIILPPKQTGETMSARWQLLADAKDTTKALAQEREQAINSLAEVLDLRKTQSVSVEELQQIYPKNSAWIIEGGANRTSVVRRTVVLRAMEFVYDPEEYRQQVVYQLGSDRVISKERNGEPNAEYKIAQEIAGDYLPDGELTEFDLNIASALQAGYQYSEQAINTHDIKTVIKIQTLEKENSPRLVMVQPSKVKGGLSDGINAVHDIQMLELAGVFVAEPYFQPVLVTNGQYRAKDEYQASEWAKENGINILPPVALGDEPGFKVTHNDKEIVTAPRGPMVYLNEIVILQRLNP